MQKHPINVIIKSLQNNKTKECFCMINHNRLGYEIKRGLSNFCEKISKGLPRPKNKFITQMVYGILAGNKVHLSEIARSLNETIPLKKTIWRLSRNLSAFGEKETVMENKPHHASYQAQSYAPLWQVPFREGAHRFRSYSFL